MTTQAERDAEWRRDWSKSGRSPEAMAKLRQCGERTVYTQRNAVFGRNPAWADLATGGVKQDAWPVPSMVQVNEPNSVHIMGSDLHAWRDPAPVMWKVFCAVAHEIQPDGIWIVGDALDGARVSRHGRQWGINPPKPQEEIDTARKWYSWLPETSAKGLPIKKRQAWGNHCDRLERYLVNMAPELDDYAGRFTDRFPDWDFAWAYTLNNQLEVRHRWHGQESFTGWGCSHEAVCRPVPQRRPRRANG